MGGFLKNWRLNKDKGEVDRGKRIGILIRKSEFK